MGKPFGAHRIQRILTRMAKGCMPQIMSQSNGLRQLLVEPQRFGNRPGNLGNLQGMGQSCPVMIPHRGQKHLGFMLQAAKCLTMQNPIPIPLISRTDIT